MAKMIHTSGVEGPRHDPYSWEELTFIRTDGVSVKVRIGGLGYERLYVDGNKVAEHYHHDTAVSDMFEGLTGLSVDKAFSIYHRRFEREYDDPMGDVGRYI